MNSDEAPVLIEYEVMVGQLERAVAAVHPAQRRGPPPVASYRQGTLAIELRSEAMPRERFFEVLEVLGKYVRTWSEFKPGLSGCTLVADVFTSYQRKPPRTGSASTPLPAPWKIAIGFDSSGGGKVTFEKDSLLMQEEVNCVLDVWRRIAVDAEAPTEDGPFAIGYDAMIAQLVEAAERDLARVTPGARNGAPPACCYRQGTVAIELVF